MKIATKGSARPLPLRLSVSFFTHHGHITSGRHAAGTRECTCTSLLGAVAHGPPSCGQSGERDVLSFTVGSPSRLIRSMITAHFAASGVRCRVLAAGRARNSRSLKGWRRGHAAKHGGLHAGDAGTWYRQIEPCNCRSVSVRPGLIGGCLPIDSSGGCCGCRGASLRREATRADGLENTSLDVRPHASSPPLPHASQEHSLGGSGSLEASVSPPSCRWPKAEQVPQRWDGLWPLCCRTGSGKVRRGTGMQVAGLQQSRAGALALPAWAGQGS